MADVVAKLNVRFAAGDQQLEPDIVAQLQSIMTMHGLSVQELFFKWEAYCIKMEVAQDTATALTMERLRAFKQDLQNALEKRSMEASHGGAGASGGLVPHKKIKTERLVATPRHAAKADVFGLLDGMMPSTPGTAGSGRKPGSGRVETPASRRLRDGHAGSSPDYKTTAAITTTTTATTPSSVARARGEETPRGPLSFRERANAGEVVEVLNPQLAAASASATAGMVTGSGAARIKLTSAFDQKKLNYYPMAMKLSEASAILDDRIDEFTTIVMDELGIAYEAFGSAASQSTSEIVAVGRIASDAPAGKLNAASVVLETSRRMGGGLRVPLDLSRLRGYQFFPGQIVALRGTNASGAAFSVSQVLELPLLPNAASSPALLATHRARMRGEDGEDGDMDAAMDMDADHKEQGAKNALPPPPLTILFASGPYTADDNLDFEPLHALVSEATATGADAVVLGGPFLDVDHPLLATGDFDLPDDAGGEAAADTATMATVFRQLVAPALHRLEAANPTVTLVLVPSTRDVVDKHVSWPQAKLARGELGLPKAARLVTNPMALSMNEMLLGISTQDILYELRHEELAAGRLAEPNAVSRACRYLLEQRHYFPLFPPVDRRRLPRTGVEGMGDGDDGNDDDERASTAAGLATGAMLDTGYLKLGEMLNVRPDVLVIPSALPPFARVVESVLVINPGYLSKRRGAGTYARMTLHAPEAAADGDGTGLVGHRVFERARVEITRI